jgi:hypothetical protein
MKIEIACPKCNWSPDGGKHWQCSCGCVWNTFDTAAKCPKCNKQWKQTQCPSSLPANRCGAFSPHIDWYKNLGNEIFKEVNSCFNTEKAIP